jgi:2-succinyl-5-enolpyruvyl-6-hydroxy-3-cyclohexene-1-carboxylate synthase
VNPAEAAAAVILDEFLRAGVQDVVLAPGQRSAPLAVAAAAAAAAGDCALHVRVDERSAAFLGVGMARASGAPVLLICTSGSAVANLAPGVWEADASDVPLVVLTADRPPELLGVGANQAADQARAFGRAVRWDAHLEAPAWRPGVVRYWRSTASQAVNAATDAVSPGPVHLNLPLREPLLGGAATDADDLPEGELADLGGRADGLPWTVDARMTSVASIAIDSLLELLGRPIAPVRGAVVVGDLAAGEPFPSEAVTLAEGLNWPLLSEPSGNARDGGTAIAHGPLLAGAAAWLAAHQPDVVVTVGRVGLTRSINALVAGADTHIAVDPRPARLPLDPQRSADLVASAVPAPSEDVRAADSWVDAWLAADDVAEGVIGEALAAQGSEGLCGVTVARTVWQTMAPDELLFAGASWPVRFLDAYAPLREEPPWVIGNRGLSGIDGLVSSAIGAATVWQRPQAGESGGPDVAGGRTVALVGDLAFLHDSNGLLVPADEGQPRLDIVVIDNDGGGIFSGLESSAGDYAEHFERVFGTPQGRDLVAVAESFGVPAVRVSTGAELLSALQGAAGVTGMRVIVARVGARAQEQYFLEGIAAQVAAQLPGSGRQ